MDKDKQTENSKENNKDNSEFYQWINDDDVHSFVNKEDFINFTKKQYKENPSIIPDFRYPKSIFDNVLPLYYDNIKY